MVLYLSELNLKQAFELFIFDRQTFCLDKTIENYENTIRYFCSYMEEKRGCPADQILLNTITTMDLKTYVVWLRNRPLNMGHPFKEPGGKLSKRSIRNYSVDLKTFFNYLHQEDYIGNIASGLKIIKAEKQAVIPLSASEVATIDHLFHCKTELGCRNYCMVHLMLDMGLRSNEVCTLKIGDVNFNNKYIRVHGKGAKERIIPMPMNLHRYLYQYCCLYRRVSKDGSLFLSIDNLPITDSVIKSLFARIRKKTGIERVKPHLLRHTFATCYILGGGSVEMLRILLGHESISTTQLYMHVAAVYEFQEHPYELDPVFFITYRHRNRRE